MSLNKTLTDINRRPVDLDRYAVTEILPLFFQSDYPTLIKLLEYYYEFLEEPDTLTVNLNDLYTLRDIRQAPDDVLINIAREFLLGKRYFENFVDKRLSLLFSNLLYRSKGTKYSIEKFFKLFFDVDVEVEYLKKDIFKVGAPITETQEYDLTLLGDIVGSNFSYALDGDVLVFIDDQELTKDVDYYVNIDTKTVSILGSIDPSYLSGSILKITSTPSNYSLIGVDLQEKKILNNKDYQLYSLLIKTPISKNIWGSTYEKFVHPAGMYYQSLVQIFSDVDLGLGSQEFSVTEEVALLVENSASAFGDGKLLYTDVTGIVADSADPEDATGLIRIPLEPIVLSDAISNYDSNSIIEINRQYGSIITAYNIKPPRMDEDSSGTGLSRDSDSYVDLSNVLEQIDQNIYDDSDGSIFI